MTAEIISVGTELLLGEVVNTDAQYISRCLSSLGIDCYFVTAVGDNKARLRQTVRTALDRSDIIILSGGLGPTTDDITKETVCEEMGLETYLDERQIEKISAYFKKRNKEMTKNNRSQAVLPVGCTVFDNDFGTACGFGYEQDGKHVILLPGPPRELQPMVDNYALPYLKRLSKEVLVTHDINIFGVGEAKIAEMLGDITNSENPTVALYCGDGEVRARVAAKAETERDADKASKPMIDKICEIMGNSVYGVDADSLEKTVVTMLGEAKKSVATAESCTGGLVAKRITAVSGSSEVFELGVVSYSGRIKNQMLGVDSSVIEKLGTVSGPVARMMAEGVRKKANADIGIATTGVAGSSFEGKPTGLVFVALCDKNKVYMRRLDLGRSPKEREYIRHIASSHALDMLRLYLCKDGDFLESGMTDEEADKKYEV